MSSPSPGLGLGVRYYTLSPPFRVSCFPCHSFPFIFFLLSLLTTSSNYGGVYLAVGHHDPS